MGDKGGPTILGCRAVAVTTHEHIPLLGGGKEGALLGGRAVAGTMCGPIHTGWPGGSHNVSSLIRTSLVTLGSFRSQVHHSKLCAEEKGEGGEWWQVHHSKLWKRRRGGMFAGASLKAV